MPAPAAWAGAAMVQEAPCGIIRVSSKSKSGSGWHIDPLDIGSSMGTVPRQESVPNGSMCHRVRGSPTPPGKCVFPADCTRRTRTLPRVRSAVVLPTKFSTVGDPRRIRSLQPVQPAVLLLTAGQPFTTGTARSTFYLRRARTFYL